VIALGRRLARAVAADGIVPGVARCLLAGLYAAVLLDGLRGGDAIAIPVMVLVFLAVYAWVLDDWREAGLVLFSPDGSLWRPPPGWNWLERLGMAACRHAVLWLVATVLFIGLPCRPLWILPLPLLASVTQRVLEGVRQRLDRRRLARFPSGARMRCALGDESRDTICPRDTASQQRRHGSGAWWRPPRWAVRRDIFVRNNGYV
jgi:hypothetical protein